MDFTGVRRRRPLRVVSDSLSDVYQHDLQLYQTPPSNEITLSEFEDIAVERLHLLRILEQATQKGHKTYSEDWKNCIKADLRKENLKGYSKLLGFSGTADEPDYQARRADHISHFILRLAFCRSEDLRRWFLSRELELFKLRFSNLNGQGIKKVLQLNKLEYTPISEVEKEEIKNELMESTAGLSSASADMVDFYKVPFVQVCSLVKSRRVYLKQGFAYIPNFELVVCILTTFRAQLSEALAYACRSLPSLDDDRINFLLSNLHTTYTGKDYTYVPTDAVDIQQLDTFSRKHYPLCMRHLHEVLRSNHHLKHFGRLQYRFFIKAIGVTYEDSVRFWKEEFCKKMDGDAFDKNHLYDIKHAYGKVGRMLNYSGYSCIKIIMSNVGPGETHGCPFKHWDSTVLRSKLVEYGLGEEAVHEIVDHSTKGQYQIACTRYYEATHGQPPSSIINHPNQYFQDSMNLSKEKDDGGKKTNNKPATEPSQPGTSSI